MSSSCSGCRSLRSSWPTSRTHRKENCDERKIAFTLKISHIINESAIRSIYMLLFLNIREIFSFNFSCLILFNVNKVINTRLRVVWRSCMDHKIISHSPRPLFDDYACECKKIEREHGFFVNNSLMSNESRA